MVHSPRFLRLVEARKQGVEEISAAQLSDKLKEKLAAVDTGFFVLDVREDHEWQGGHIPSAVHLSKGILERDIERLIPDPQTEIVLYCAGGFRSILAADTLETMGYLRVRSLAGGYKGWVEKGLPTEPSSPGEP